ncbi:MAG: hypothetical protein LUO93_02110 [Methanomicrobiales archaeon]|nr:hypothetical protein [Methanomicrobiales archaeon]
MGDDLLPAGAARGDPTPSREGRMDGKKGAGPPKGKPALSGSKPLLPLGVESRAVTAERSSACPGLQVVLLDVVSFRAGAVVVVDRLARAR